MNIDAAYFLLGGSIVGNIILAWGWYAYHQRNRPPF